MKRSIILILVSLLTYFSHNQILAIDYGTQFIKAALVHTGAGKTFSIVENPKSQRKFINAMGLYNQERFYEADTLSKRSRGPANCFIYSRLLVDLHTNPSQLERVKKELVLQYLAHPESDQLLAQFVLTGMGQAASSISLLESVAMMIKYVKRQAQKSAKATLKDTVLIVPSHWNLQQRKFLVQAATLADLSVLTLINENTAAALNYAVTQRTTNNTEKILFYNLGANSLQMTLAEFKQVKLQKSKTVESVFILGDYGRPFLGGLAFDSLIANYFHNIFQQKYKKTLNQRAMIRLLAESEKVKKVLSSNKEASVFVEGIMDGLDFSATITRKQFEELAQSTFQKLTGPVRRFIFDHDLKPDELTAVQMIGGGSRIPRLQALLGESIGNTSIIGSHINGDEAMVFGAAFYGANSSKKFKVKGINLYDGFNFDMRIVLRNADESIEQGDSNYYFKNATLFKKKNRFGLTKEVSFKCKQNLIVEIYKQDDIGIQLLARYKIDSISDINQSNYKISLTFQIHPVDVIKLQQVQYLYSKEIVQSYTEKVKKVIPINKTEQKEEKSEEDSDGKQTKKQKESEQTTQKEDTKQEKQSEKTQEEKEEKADSNATETNKTKSSKKKEKKQKIQYETVERFRNVTKNYEQDLIYKKVFAISGQSISQELAVDAKKLFAVFQQKQQFKRSLAESKNKLQALIYEVRDRLQNSEFLQYSQQQQKELLNKLVQQKNLWYQDTSSSDPNEYKKQFRQLNNPLEKIKKRIVEHREREEVFKRATDITKDYLNQTKKLQSSKAWITDQEITSLVSNITQVQQNIKRTYEKLKETPMNEDSIYHNKDLIKQADTVKDQFFLLKGKQKPKGFKDPKQQKKEQKKDEQKKDEVNQDEL